MRRNTRNISFEKISKEYRSEILYDLIFSIVSCKNIEEAAMFMEDLLTKAELEFISRRLRIAKLLLDGKTYGEIKELLHTSDTTISKVAIWLSEKGDGFRNVIKSFPKEATTRKTEEYSSWKNIKRRYPSYFLPEIIIEEIIVMANNKQKARLQKAVSGIEDSLKEKSQLHKNIELLLKSKGA